MKSVNMIIDNEALQQPSRSICYLKVNKVVDMLKRSEKRIKKRAKRSFVQEKGQK